MNLKRCNEPDSAKTDQRVDYLSKVLARYLSRQQRRWGRGWSKRQRDASCSSRRCLVNVSAVCRLLWGVSYRYRALALL